MDKWIWGKSYTTAKEIAKVASACAYQPIKHQSHCSLISLHGWAVKVSPTEIKIQIKIRMKKECHYYDI